MTPVQKEEQPSVHSLLYLVGLAATLLYTTSSCTHAMGTFKTCLALASSAFLFLSSERHSVTLLLIAGRELSLQTPTLLSYITVSERGIVAAG